MEIAIDWSENSKGELVGKVLNPKANVQKLVDEVKNAPVDFPNLKDKTATKTIEVVGVPAKDIEAVEQALSGITESAVQLSSCKYKLNLEPDSQPDF